jgi:hypothetical protein
MHACPGRSFRVTEPQWSQVKSGRPDTQTLQSHKRKRQRYHANQNDDLYNCSHFTRVTLYNSHTRTAVLPNPPRRASLHLQCSLPSKASIPASQEIGLGVAPHMHGNLAKRMMNSPPLGFHRAVHQCHFPHTNLTVTRKTATANLVSAQKVAEP